jgi:hypothetical protein
MGVMLMEHNRVSFGPSLGLFDQSPSPLRAFPNSTTSHAPPTPQSKPAPRPLLNLPKRRPPCPRKCRSASGTTDAPLVVFGSHIEWLGLIDPFMELNQIRPLLCFALSTDPHPHFASLSMSLTSIPITTCTLPILIVPNGPFLPL